MKKKLAILLVVACLTVWHRLFVEVFRAHPLFLQTSKAKAPGWNDWDKAGEFANESVAKRRLLRMKGIDFLLDVPGDFISLDENYFFISFQSTARPAGEPVFLPLRAPPAFI